jgi:hypothetical protein
MSPFPIVIPAKAGMTKEEAGQVLLTAAWYKTSCYKSGSPHPLALKSFLPEQRRRNPSYPSSFQRRLESRGQGRSLLSFVIPAFAGMTKESCRSGWASWGFSVPYTDERIG